MHDTEQDGQQDGQHDGQHDNVRAFLARTKPLVETGIQELRPAIPGNGHGVFSEAVRYSLASGGKRLRPLLTIFVAKTLGADEAQALPVAVATEFVHTSSLILDDLPCMDDSPVRRGRPSLHKQYGEGTALLVAIALLNRSYELVIESDSPHRLRLHAQLTRAIGLGGMISGQAADLANGEVDDVLLKTTALFRACFGLGATLAGCKPELVDALERFAVLVGTAFQLSDDIRDCQEDMPRLGVPEGTAGHYQQAKRTELDSALGEAEAILGRLRPRALSHAMREVMNLCLGPALAGSSAGSIAGSANAPVDASVPRPAAEAVAPPAGTSTGPISRTRTAALKPRAAVRAAVAQPLRSEPKTRIS